MKRGLVRLALLAAPFGLGVLVGVAWSRQACQLAQAAERPVAASRPAAGKVLRFGSVIGVRPEKLDEYVRLHAAVWPEVLQRLKDSNVRNYSIYLGKLDDGKLYLFSYLEYVGVDFEGDMKRMADDPASQRWWKLTDPCQIPQRERKPGEHWMGMREVFHMD